jgi:hypothetical protein
MLLTSNEMNAICTAQDSYLKAVMLLPRRAGLKHHLLLAGESKGYCDLLLYPAWSWWK